MRIGFAALTVAYVLSQFYRAFLAVLAPVLDTDIGASAEDLAFASGIWLAAFAGLQLPIGYALDYLGPRRTAGGLVLAAVGAAVFAVAHGPTMVTVAMALIGAGCAPALMVSLYIFARAYPPAMFASLTGLLIGVSSVGNLAAATPMAWAAETIGWRACLWGLAIVTLLITLALVAFVHDPPRAAAAGHDGAGLLALMRTPSVLLLVPLTFAHYAPVAGVRGLWVGPYLADVFHLNALALGNVSLAMGIAMILGSLAYGPLDRLLGTRKGVLLGGNLRGKPTVIVAGRSDALLPVNHAARAYAAWSAKAEGAASALRYYEVTNGNHFDAFLPAVGGVAGYDTLLVPMHVYFVQAMDLVWAKLKTGAALPPSQVVRTTPRGGTPGAAPAITATNVPRIATTPADADKIGLASGAITVPD